MSKKSREATKSHFRLQMLSRNGEVFEEIISEWPSQPPATKDLKFLSISDHLEIARLELQHFCEGLRQDKAFRDEFGKAITLAEHKKKDTFEFMGHEMRTQWSRQAYDSVVTAKDKR